MRGAQHGHFVESVFLQRGVRCELEAPRRDRHDRSVSRSPSALTLSRDKLSSTERRKADGQSRSIGCEQRDQPIEANCIIVVADGRGQVFRRQPPASANACSRGLGWNIPKNTKGRDVSLLIKAVIAMARDIATAVDSAGLLRRRRRRWRKWRSDKARMAFLEEKGCVSWDISAAPRRSGREYYGSEPK
jgi:hypothetical protein